VTGDIGHGFYVPASEDCQYGRPIDIQVLEKHGETNHWPYKRVSGPLYWDVRDYVDEDKRERILRSRTAAQSVCLGVPTRNGGHRIYRVGIHLEAELRAVKAKHPDWMVNLVVASNGSTDNTEREVIRLQRDLANSPVGITLISMPIAGKVDALNVIHLYARSLKATILAVADDDVQYSPMALLINIQALLDSHELSIVGSAYQPLPPQNLWGELVSVASRCREVQTIPNGRMMILFDETYPMIPSYIIADDFHFTALFLDLEAADPLRRILINKATRVTYAPPATLRQLLGHYERVLLGWEQILRLAPQDRRRFLTEVLGQSTWLANLKRPWYKAETARNAGLNLAFLVLIRALRLKMFIELMLRKRLGIPKKVCWF
jgi:glycosyltransferase involved in cell wall biosynthesis